ncbi:hypothetical protein BV898_07602 [Hypsibius exemplaris]|uniref:Peptidase M12A domain-containing protein n=1 Tax=Hypsibius exemplaris TaxID=2072580 RepID=A0A1W0WT70_HYPEX|nr:hypothetical protein BV898_07602 [Hypsibius exemplaris]
MLSPQRLRIVILLLLLLLLLLNIARFSEAGTINAPGNGFTRWPTNVISYKYIGGNAEENDLIQRAFDEISFDTGGCVNFTALRPDSTPNQPHLVIQNALPSPDVSDICLTFPGYNARQGIRGQAAIMFSQASTPRPGAGPAAGACLDNLRDAVALLLNAIGIRNEYQRSDRDGFMIFPTDVNRNLLVDPSLQRYDLFGEGRKYNASQAVNSNPVFDKDSVTMVTGTRYAGSSVRSVFTTVNNDQVGRQFRLSFGDCQTVRALYNCQGWYLGRPGETGCRNPYSNPFAISFDLDEPATLTRTLQCLPPNTALPTLPFGGIPLGQFLIRGLTFTAGTTPVFTIVQGFTGLTVQPVAILRPVTLFAGTGAGASTVVGAGEPRPCPSPPGAATCGWSAKFTLTTPQTSGQLNRQIQLDIQVNSVFQASLTLTLNLNCAPQFQSITANVGYSASMTSPVTKTAGTGIRFVTASTLAAAPYVQASTSQLLTPFMINYNMPTAFGESGAAGGTPKKVFVNCVNGGTRLFGGTTAVATVLAIDPEGGPISYFAYSGIPQVAALPTAGAGPGPELHTVTKDGVVFISAFSRTIEAATPSGSDLFAGDAASNIGNAPLARDMQIVAVDAQGASSVLQARFYFDCGIGVG